jgi:hypothetical protein
MANLRQELFDLVDVAFDKVDPVLDSEYQGGSAEYLRERGKSFSNWRAVVDIPALPNFFAPIPLAGILGAICFTRLTTPYYLAAFLTRIVQEGLNDSTLNMARNLIWLYDRFQKMDIPPDIFSHDWFDDRQKEGFKRVVVWLKLELDDSGLGVAMVRKKVLAQIKQSFSGVRLGDGTSLLQARDKDDYCYRPELWKDEERNEWIKVIDNPEFEGHMRCAEYCFFDKLSFRFYFPVMLTRILRFPDSCDGSLEAVGNSLFRYTPEDWELNSAQCSSIHSALEFVMLENFDLLNRIWGSLTTRKAWLQV